MYNFFADKGLYSCFAAGKAVFGRLEYLQMWKKPKSLAKSNFGFFYA